MRYLFVNFHPVDPQVVRYVAYELQRKGHELMFAFVEKENIIEKLILSFGFSAKRIGKTRNSIFGRIINTLLVDINLFFLIKKFRPNIVFSPSSPYVGYITKLLNLQYIAWADTETASVNLRHSLSNINALLLVDCFYSEIKSRKVVRFKGYKEIAYCHPAWFTPNDSILTKLNIKKNEKIILMRFSALRALHDIGLVSAGLAFKDHILNFIKTVEKSAHIFISVSERSLGPEFEKYELRNILPSDYLDLLSFCTLYIGEGTTTASEAGVLGVPWIALRPHPLGYLVDQEKKYGLGFRTDNLELAFETAFQWIKRDDLKTEWSKKREKLLKEKIDVSAFLIWFIENYPQSHRIIKENPDYQNRFK